MKALTTRQPWVHAILHEGKDVENRSWTVKYRGWIAIHAAASPSKDAAYPRGVKMPLLDGLEYSAIDAVVRLSDIRTPVRSKWFYRPPKGAKNYGWLLSSLQRLKSPIRCKGSLGLWKVPTRVLTRIKKQLPRLKLE